LHLSPSGKLLFYDVNGNLLGTGTTTLNPNQTYTIGVRVGSSSNGGWEVRISGNLEMNGTGNLDANNGSILLGGNSNYTANYYYDDVSISGQGFSGQGPVVTSPGNQTAVEGATTFISLGSFN